MTYLPRSAAQPAEYAMSPRVSAATAAFARASPERVFQIWKAGTPERATQLIFSDLGLPSAAEKRGFSAYTHIRESLIKRGVSAKEIAVIQDYKTPTAK